jgi:hypothetical protein
VSFKIPNDYLPKGERDTLRSTANAVLKKHHFDLHLTEDQWNFVIDAIHACGFYLVRRATIMSFDQYCERANKALLQTLGLEPLEHHRRQGLTTITRHK